MSNRSIELRRRKREIINIIHHATTMIEYFGFSMFFVIQFLLLGGIISHVSNGIALTLKIACPMILVPFSHLFNEHRIKVMVLEHGWIFAMKNAIRFNVDSRVAPISNRSTQNRENNGLGTNNIDVKITGKILNQEHIQCIIPPPAPPKKNDIGTKLDKSSYGQKDEYGLPNQVPTV